MSEAAKAARAAMKKKASRLAGGDPKAKVDASDWTPPEMMNTNAKTGLRPVSRRAFKSGGKVNGMDCAPRADRKARKSGGAATQFANAKVNRNVKDANAEKFGKPHVGGYKKGGRAHKDMGGPMVDPRAAAATQRAGVPKARMDFVRKAAVPLPGSSGMKKGGRAERAAGGKTPDAVATPEQMEALRNYASKNGRSWREKLSSSWMRGGDHGPELQRARNTLGPSWLGKVKIDDEPSTPPVKLNKGGMVNGDESQDKKLIKKAFRQHENAEHGGKHAEMKLRKGGRAHRENGGQTLTDAQRAIAAGKNPFGGDKTSGPGGTLMPKMMAPPMNPKKRMDPYGGDRTPPRGMPAPDMVPAEDGMKKGGRAKRADGGRFDSAMAAAQALQDARRGVAPGLKGGALMASRRSQALKAAMAMDAARSKPSGDELASTVNKRGTAYLANKDRSTPGIGQRLKSMIGMGGPRAVPSMPEASGPSDAEYSRYKASISPTKLGGMKKGGVAKGNYTGGTRPTGGRVAKAGGGRAKGKTNINIIIGAGKPQDGMPMPGGSGPIRPPGMPVVTPPPAGAPPAAAAPMPMPIPMPMPAPAGGAPGGMPGRKEGGRVGHRTYRSYKDMDAGGLSGFGRLEKVEIQKTRR